MIAQLAADVLSIKHMYYITKTKFKAPIDIDF